MSKRDYRITAAHQTESSFIPVNLIFEDRFEAKVFFKLVNRLNAHPERNDLSLDEQNLVSMLVKDYRKEMMVRSGQMTLGSIISEFEKLVNKQYKIKLEYGREAYVVFDFEYLYPTNIYSWRESYDELALNFKVGAKSGEMATEFRPFLNMLRNAVGKTFTNY